MSETGVENGAAAGTAFANPNDPVNAATNAVSAAASDAGVVTSFLGDLSSASFWIRALEIVGGGVLFLLGVYLLTRQVGLNYSPVSAVLPQAAKGAADSAAPAPAPRRRVVNQYYLEEPALTRRARLASRVSDPAANEIPY